MAMGSISNLLEVRGVTKVFRYGLLGFKFKAIEDISMVLEEKPLIFTVAGESGSGKSTLAKIILDIYRPDKGTVLYRGRDIYRLSSKERLWFRSEVQAVFQNPYSSFNPMRRLYSYLYETSRNFMKLKNIDADPEEEIDKTLRLVGLTLDEIRYKHPHELSGGQLQRVSIARALLSRPKLIVADEPVSMLDASLRVNILNIFREIKENLGISFIYITHDLSTAYYISDYIAIMYRGWIVEQGPIEKVFKDPKHPYTQLLLESIPEPDLSKKKEWLQPIKLGGIEEKEYIAEGCKYRFRCPFAFDKCRKTPPDIKLGDSGIVVKCWLYEK